MTTTYLSFLNQIVARYIFSPKPNENFSESKHSSNITPKIEKRKRTVSLENTEDLASGDALNLSDTVRVTKNHTDLWWCQTLLGKLAYVLLHLYISTTINTHQKWHTNTQITESERERERERERVRIRVLKKYILRRDLEPTRWSSLVWQCWGWNTLTEKSQKPQITFKSKRAHTHTHIYREREREVPAAVHATHGGVAWRRRKKWSSVRFFW